MDGTFFDSFKFCEKIIYFCYEMKAYRQEEQRSQKPGTSRYDIIISPRALATLGSAFVGT
jgi:hypothetical protein